MLGNGAAPVHDGKDGRLPWGIVGRESMGCPRG